MVTSVLDAKITEKIVRLGTRSSDERIAEYTLDKLEKLASASTLDRSMKRQYAKMKELEERMTKTITSIRLPLLNWEKIEEYLDIQQHGGTNKRTELQKQSISLEIISKYFLLVIGVP